MKKESGDGLSFPETFKALSDPTRREMLNLLKERPLSAGEICEHFDTTGATISHHLSILKSADLINDKRVGKFIYYELNLSVFEEVLNWFNDFLGKENVTDEK
jgi:DNA-binding transcriptional ArsR family regulator